jgi:hypothetical protein
MAADLPPLVLGADGPPIASRGGALAGGSLPSMSARRWQRRPTSHRSSSAPMGHLLLPVAVPLAGGSLPSR